MASLEGPFELWDEKLQGLSARRQTDGGRITYRFRYVNGEGRKVNVVVGDASAFKTPDEARKEAKLIAGQAESARRGGRPDPAAERDASRRLPTLGEMWADYEAAGLGRLRASTATLHRQLWRAHIAPRFASMRIDCLSSAEIERWHAETSLAKAAPIAERRAVFRRRGGPDIAGRAARLLRRLQAASAPGAPLCETWAAHMQIIAGHSRFARARAAIQHGGARACYNPATDTIYLPPRHSFVSTAQYFSTWLHELGHWSGHSTRLARGLQPRASAAAYAREELVAELTSAFLGAELGLPVTHLHCHASYIDAWLKILDRDPGALLAAAGHAKRAADYLRASFGKIAPLKRSIDIANLR